MTKKIYRTAQGKLVDLGALQLRNENVRAVGNMGVNARGDLVDGQNRTVRSRNQQVARQYRKQTNVEDSPVGKQSAVVPTPPEDFQDDFVKPAITEPSQSPAEPSPSAGLAAAIARARQIKQEPLKTPRQVAQMEPGVRKI